MIKSSLGSVLSIPQFADNGNHLPITTYQAPIQELPHKLLTLLPVKAQDALKEILHLLDGLPLVVLLRNLKFLPIPYTHDLTTSTCFTCKITNTTFETLTRTTAPKVYFTI